MICWKKETKIEGEKFDNAIWKSSSLAHEIKLAVLFKAI